MERPDNESTAHLLKDRPLPWSQIPGFRPGESEIVASNGKPVMRVTTNQTNHQTVIDLILYMLPRCVPEVTTLQEQQWNGTCQQTNATN